jgi:hypothetical protein
MPAKKTLITLLAATLLSLPAWAPSFAAAHPGGAGTSAEGANGHRQHNGRGAERSAGRADGEGSGHGRKSHGTAGSHGCKVHTVAYVVAGTLVSESLLPSATGTYSGEVTLEVKRSNHRGAEAKGRTESFKVQDVRVTIGLRSASGGRASIEEVKAGDRVKLIGRVTFMPKRCTREGFTPTVTIKHIILHGAAS